MYMGCKYYCVCSKYLLNILKMYIVVVINLYKSDTPQRGIFLHLIGAEMGHPQVVIHSHSGFANYNLK